MGRMRGRMRSKQTVSACEPPLPPLHPRAHGIPTSARESSGRCSCRPAAICSKCNNNKAFFQQLQIRAADEPMTNFFKCVGCGFRWREECDDD